MEGTIEEAVTAEARSLQSSETSWAEVSVMLAEVREAADRWDHSFEDLAGETGVTPEQVAHVLVRMTQQILEG